MFKRQPECTEVSYKYLVTGYAVAICSDLNSLFMYPDFIVSLPNSLYIMFPVY